MEIIGGIAAPATPGVKDNVDNGDNGGGGGGGNEDAVMKAFVEARREVLGGGPRGSGRSEAEEKSPDDIVATASVGKAMEDDSVLKASVDTSKSGESTGVATAKDLLSGAAAVSEVKITRAMKDQFLDCVVSGKRYRSQEVLYGGRLRVSVRCRSLDETDAIESYLRRMVSLGRISSPSEYANAARRCLLVAQVSEVNGVEYQEMAKPYKFTETGDGLNPPAWEAQMDVFGRMPEQIVSALSGCVLRFEAAYWRMVSMAGDENFWNPGESTGE